MTEYLAALQAEFPLLVYTIVFCFGAIFGSFLNVVIHRLPIMLQRDWESQAHEVLGNDYTPPTDAFNLVFPNSHCPACDTEIRPWENIPLISYAILRGRCAHCGSSISLRYPIIEALTGMLLVLVVAHFGLTLTGFACMLMTLGLIAGSMIDYDHQIIPDDITLPLLWLGLTVNYFGLIAPFHDAFWGAVAGYLALWIVYQIFKALTGKEGMGFGDFKLLGMLGAWMGWQMLPLIIILSSFAGALIGGCLILLGRDRAQPIPFGPYLSIAGFIALLWGEDITSAYLQFAAF